MYNGIINIHKEAGFTSHDVVAKMRGILKQKKIGHTGTLDPQATGVLPVCLGSGTKLCDMLTDRDKEYVAELLLGVVTDTQDTTGQVLRERAVKASEEQVRAAVLGFRGDYEQVPPMYSALKVDGRKLYELARAGREVERKARPVVIHDIEISEMELPVVKLRVVCSKGTYIRTLCADIGERLGCGGTMRSLVRTRVGRFALEEAVTLSELERLRDEGRIREVLTPVDALFKNCPALLVKPAWGRLLENGNTLGVQCVEMREDADSGHIRDGLDEERTEAGASPCGAGRQVRLYRADGSFAGVYAFDEESRQYRPVKMFLERD